MSCWQGGERAQMRGEFGRRSVDPTVLLAATRGGRDAEGNDDAVGMLKLPHMDGRLSSQSKSTRRSEVCSSEAIVRT